MKFLTWIIFLSTVISVVGCARVAPTPLPATEEFELPTPTEALTPSPIPISITVPSITDSPTITENPTSIAYGPKDFPENINPLTGLEVADLELLNRRPISVKVQLFPRGQRPPWGVNNADIVFDYYQNNGLTRLNAVFYGKDAEIVGPIRSARLFDANVLQMYKAILAFGGADPRILSKFRGYDFADRMIFEGYQNCPPMCRVDPEGFNFLVTDTAELSKYATEKGIPNERQNLDGMSFNAQVPQGGQPSHQIYTRYSISSYDRWDYDPSSGRYLRFQDTQEAHAEAEEVYGPLTDQLSNSQIVTDNLVIIFAITEFVYRSQSGSSEIVDVELEDSGDALAFRDGQVFQVKWNRPKKDSVLYLTFQDGSLYPYKSGTTWYQILGKTSKIEQRGEGVYRIVFNTP